MGARGEGRVRERVMIADSRWAIWRPSQWRDSLDVLLKRVQRKKKISRYEVCKYYNERSRSVTDYLPFLHYNMTAKKVKKKKRKC